mmetsp:Transcript_11813/g.13142  ORF Transcript_11813/g.13142 Transcript_11813/m.13142 type:complete len:537 (+) Transcript_11813:127-1737(+)
MVLTDRQRRELHLGIYEYLLSQGPAFEDAATALAEADPSVIREDDPNSNNDVSDNASVASMSSRFSTSSYSSKFSTGGLSVMSKSATLPVLERKWTAVPRLQKKVLELEKMLRTNAKIYGSQSGGAGVGLVVPTGKNVERRMLPRQPCAYELKGHAGVIGCVAIHPTFTLAVSGSEDGTVKIWDHESGEYVRTLKGHTNSVHSLAFTPTGTHLASSSSDLTIKLWDFKTYACVRTLRGHDHTISCIKFLPLPTHHNSTISTTTNNNDRYFEESSSTGIDSTTSGSSFLISASRDKCIKFWDLETGFCDYTICDHSDWVRCIAVRETDGQYIATAGNDQSIYVYNTSNERKKVATLDGHEHVIESIAFVTSKASSSTTSTSMADPSDENTAATTISSSSTTTTTTSSDLKKTTSFTNTLNDKKTSEQKHSDRINDFLASGGRDRTVRLWNISTQSCIAVFKYHENWVRSVLLHPSGKYIISAGDDRSIRVMDIKSQRCLRTIVDAHPHFVTSVAMHPSLPIMVSGGVDQTLRCWQLD